MCVAWSQGLSEICLRMATSSTEKSNNWRANATTSLSADEVIHRTTKATSLVRNRPTQKPRRGFYNAAFDLDFGKKRSASRANLGIVVGRRKR